MGQESPVVLKHAIVKTLILPNISTCLGPRSALESAFMDKLYQCLVSVHMLLNLMKHAFQTHNIYTVGILIQKLRLLFK